MPGTDLCLCFKILYLLISYVASHLLIGLAYTRLYLNVLYICMYVTVRIISSSPVIPQYHSPTCISQESTWIQPTKCNVVLDDHWSVQSPEDINQSLRSWPDLTFAGEFVLCRLARNCPGFLLFSILILHTYRNAVCT